MKKLLPIIVFFLIACGGQKQSENSTVVAISTPAPTGTIKPVPTDTIKTNAQNVKPIINFSELANKSPAEIEKIYGKPSFIDTKIVQSEDGQFRIYDKSGKRFLQVDFYNGKAVGFYLEIPEAIQTQSAEETLKLCGLNLFVTDAEVEKGGDDLWWKNPPKPFYSVRLSKFSDSRLYWNCEAHIKVKD